MSAITLGIGIATNNNSKKDVELTKADSYNQIKVYVEPFDAGSDKGGKWSNFKYYLFGPKDDNGWPGAAFTDDMKTKTPNENGMYQYELTIDTSKYQSMVLTGNSDNSWDYAFAKTEDITLSDVANKGIYCGTHQGWQTDANVFSIESYEYKTKKIYLYDIKGSIFNTTHKIHAWADGHSGTTVWPGIDMSKEDGTNNIYFAEINNALNRIIFNDSTDDHKTAEISGFSSGNVFIVYPDNGYNVTSVKASKFIDKYMKFETKWLDDNGDGSCKSAGWYSAAKYEFIFYSDSIKTKILTHEPTKYRLSAWAKANGDTFDPSTATFSSARITPILSVAGDNNAMTIVVIISILSITAIGGYFFFRKNRNKEEQ